MPRWATHDTKVAVGAGVTPYAPRILASALALLRWLVWSEWEGK
jgi:hypothetical protein